MRDKIICFIFIINTMVVISNRMGDSILENTVPCLDSNLKYRKRPTDRVSVKSQISIIALHDLNSKKMELTGDVYWIQEWRDSRCQFRPLPGGQGNRLTLYTRSGQVSHSGLRNLWQPDTNILNAKSISAPETVTHIRSYGRVESRTRLTVIASCPMDLHLFPMDRQICSFIFQSSAHPNDQLTYKWWNGSLDTKLNLVQGLKYQDAMTPELRLLGYRFRNSSSRSDELMLDRVYDQLILDLFLERPIGYYLFEVYMPASFIVLMSFTSFWLDPAATPARVSLGVTTVLTITTLLSNANNNLPATAYPKALGIFLAGCFLFTFMALLEYTLASYIPRSKYRLIDKDSEIEMEEKDQPKTPNKLNFNASIFDVRSRSLFPLCFLLFQIVYWTILFSSMEQLPSDIKLLREH